MGGGLVVRGQCVTKSSPHDFVMLQGHRYLEPPILGVQRRRVKSLHPNSQSPHTSNSVQNCASSTCPDESSSPPPPPKKIHDDVVM